MKPNERLPEILASAVLMTACLLTASLVCGPIEIPAAATSLADYVTGLPGRWQSTAELYMAGANLPPLDIENFCSGGRALTPPAINAPCYSTK